jgi:hypothetical protein
MHLLSHVDDGIGAGKRIHGVANGHNPGCASGPPADTVEFDEEACTVEAVGHGTEHDDGDDEASDGHVQTHLRPLSKVPGWYGEDGDHWKKEDVRIYQLGIRLDFQRGSVHLQVIRIKAT